MRSFWAMPAAFLIASACANGASDGLDPSNGGFNNTGLLTRLASDPYAYLDDSGIASSLRVVVRSADEWNALWDGAGQFAPPVPDVDFSQEMLVVAALGTKRTGGYNIILESAQETDGGSVEVQVRSSSPGSSCVVTQAITAPLDVARMAKRDGAITFKEVSRVKRC